MGPQKDAELWERQAGEPARAFHAFTIYRGMNPSERSVRAVAKAIGHNTHTMSGRWSSVHNWPKRVAAWDDEIDRVRRLKFLEDVEAITNRQLKIAEEFIAKASEALKATEGDAAVPLKVALRFFDTASKVQRELLGIPSVVHVTGDEDRPVGVKFVRVRKPKDDAGIVNDAGPPDNISD